jgi:hypothetical protein
MAVSPMVAFVCVCVCVCVCTLVHNIVKQSHVMQRLQYCPPSMSIQTPKTRLLRSTLSLFNLVKAHQTQKSFGMVRVIYSVLLRALLHGCAFLTTVKEGAAPLISALQMLKKRAALRNSLSPDVTPACTLYVENFLFT